MKKNKEELKKYFETGDKPTQLEYEDVIDSFVHKDDLSTVRTGYEPIKQMLSISGDIVEGVPETLEILNPETAVGGNNLQVLNTSKGYSATFDAENNTIIATKDAEHPRLYHIYIEYAVTKHIANVGNVVGKYTFALSMHNG